MKIGIDARFLTHPQPGGFKTYTEHLARALAGIDSENEYILYVDRAPGKNTQLPQRHNMSVQVVPGTLPMLGMLWREQVRLAQRAVRDQLDLLHAPALTAPLFARCPFVVTIFDTIWRYPERYANGRTISAKRRLMGWYYRAIPSIAARKARAVLTCSHASKLDIVGNLGIPPSKIFVTHLAPGAASHPIPTRQAEALIRAQYQLAPNYILALGSADPRKNLVTLVQAYAALPTALRDQHELVIVWTHSALAANILQQAADLGISKRLRCLDRVADENLASLYSAAALFAFPSLYEGFGLPPLEAMACGTPVVAAGNSSIPEIVGDAAIMFEAENVPALAHAMATVLADSTLRNQLAELGRNRALTFSWQKCALETAEVYNQALNHNTRQGYTEVSKISR